MGLKKLAVLRNKIMRPKRLDKRRQPFEQMIEEAKDRGFKMHDKDQYAIWKHKEKQKKLRDRTPEKFDKDVSRKAEKMKRSAERSIKEIDELFKKSDKSAPKKNPTPFQEFATSEAVWREKLAARDSARNYINKSYRRMAKHPTTELNDARNRLVDAASRRFTNEDMFDIIKNPETLSLITNNKQARDALLELLENRDNNVLHAYNRATGGSILREDWNNRPVVEAREAAEKSAAQSEIDSMIPKPTFDESYIGGFGNDVAPERSGMSAVSRKEMGNPLRQRMVEYYERKGDNTLSDMDELLMSNLTNKELGKSKRLAKSMRDESARLLGDLQGKAKERLNRPFTPEDPSKAKKLTDELRAKRIKEEKLDNRKMNRDEYLEHLYRKSESEKQKIGELEDLIEEYKGKNPWVFEEELSDRQANLKRMEDIIADIEGKEAAAPRSDVEYIFDNMEGADRRSFMDYKPERKDPWVEWIDNKAKRKGTYYDQAEYKEELRKILETRINEIKKSGKNRVVPINIVIRGMNIPTGVKVSELDILKQSYHRKQKTPKYKSMSESELEMRKKTKAPPTKSNDKIGGGMTASEKAELRRKFDAIQPISSKKKKIVDESLVEKITKTENGKKVPWFRIRGSMVNGKYREFRRLEDALAYLRRQTDE